MLSLPPQVRVFVCTQPTDMRKSFDGLSGLVAEVFRVELLSGHLFVFFNRRRDRLKILAWDRDGLCLWYKRLEAGTFQIPAATGNGVELDATELSLLLSGIDLHSAQRRRRFRRPAA
jgi:transposase